MSAQENIALVRRYFEEVWAEGNVAAVEDFMAADYVEHTVPPGSRPGRDILKQYVAMYHNACPDVRGILHDILAQEDRARPTTLKARCLASRGFGGWSRSILRRDHCWTS